MAGLAPYAAEILDRQSIMLGRSLAVPALGGEKGDAG
jgi:hypothetical protein